MCIYIYIYLYLYMYIYICVYIHIYIYPPPCPCGTKWSDRGPMWFVLMVEFISFKHAGAPQPKK